MVASAGAPKVGSAANARRMMKRKREYLRGLETITPPCQNQCEHMHPVKTFGAVSDLTGTEIDLYRFDAPNFAGSSAVGCPSLLPQAAQRGRPRNRAVIEEPTGALGLPGASS